jgi:hypothetical protein
VQLGIRQDRYIGRTKTLFQLLVAAAVANLTRLANAAGEPRRAPDDLLGAAMRLASALVVHPLGQLQPRAVRAAQQWQRLLATSAATYSHQNARLSAGLLEQPRATDAADMWT